MKKVTLTQDQRSFLEYNSLYSDLFDTYVLVGTSLYRLSNSIPTENYMCSILSYHTLPPQLGEVISRIIKKITWALKSD